MRELENYQAYSARSRCTIPLCVTCHRDLHSRNNTDDKSIWRYLTAEERAFAQKMLDELREHFTRARPPTPTVGAEARGALPGLAAPGRSSR
jgi:hypothetical protein